MLTFLHAEIAKWLLSKDMYFSSVHKSKRSEITSTSIHRFLSLSGQINHNSTSKKVILSSKDSDFQAVFIPRRKVILLSGHLDRLSGWPAAGPSNSHPHTLFSVAPIKSWAPSRDGNWPSVFPNVSHKSSTSQMCSLKYCSAETLVPPGAGEGGGTLSVWYIFFNV